jgi:hypothetical protein
MCASARTASGSKCSAERETARPLAMCTRRQPVLTGRPTSASPGTPLGIHSASTMFPADTTLKVAGCSIAITSAPYAMDIGYFYFFWRDFARAALSSVGLVQIVPAQRLVRLVTVTVYRTVRGFEKFLRSAVRALHLSAVRRARRRLAGFSAGTYQVKRKCVPRRGVVGGPRSRTCRRPAPRRRAWLLSAPCRPIALACEAFGSAPTE